MSALSVADVLERAADLIEPEGAWTQNELARDKRCNAIDPDDPAAVCWCAEGAIAATDATYETHSYAMSMLRSRIFTDMIYEWNDAFGRTQAEVVAKLREAAALARKDEA